MTVHERVSRCTPDDDGPKTGTALASSGDCERRPGRWRQPVNTLSSSAYVIAGAVMGEAARRRRRGPAPAALAAALVLEGVGSAAFHGRGDRFAHALHDLPLLVLAGHVAGWHVGRLARGAPARTADRAALAGGASAVVLGGVARRRWPLATDAVVGASALTTAVADGAARRLGLAPVWHAPLAGLLAASTVAWWAGRSGSRWCRPASRAQAHALWHAGSAAVLAWWGHRAVSGTATRA
jgi:hypothetical protein